MADLGVILISGHELVDNLGRALGEAAPKPWAFTKWIRQMQGLTTGTYVAWIEFIDGQGRQVNRFTPSNAELHARRVVLGKVASPVVERGDPFFEGYPFEFRFADSSDEVLDPMRSVVETTDWLNTHIDELGLAPDQLATLVGHAKSNKVGLFIDGAPRMADFFSTSATTSDDGVSPSLFVSSESEPAVDASALTAAIDAFAVAVETSGLRFLGANAELPRALLASLVAKRFAILTGLSGSGKTLLARALGQWLGADASGCKRYVVIPVRPDWTSPEPLLGYEDALLPPSKDGRRAWFVPEVLRFILQASREPEGLWLLVLDEMNLAHVERYFADVLSGVESGESMLPNLRLEDDGYWRIPAGGDSKLALPANLLVVGTVNVDETTYQFSPKVLDRAFSFEFRVASSELDGGARRPSEVAPTAKERHTTLLTACDDDALHIDHPLPSAPAVAEQLRDLHEQLSLIGFEFGHRTFFEAGRFAWLLNAAGVADPDLALDWIVMTKILPRLHGSRRQLETLLEDLVTTATGSDPDKPVMPLTARKSTRMLELVRANQFVSFAE